MFEVITGLIQFGKAIGSQFKADAEKFTSEGELVDKEKARKTAIVGAFFDPLQAVKTRASYEGGWTDWTGSGYVEHIETQEKGKIAFFREQEKKQKIKQQQLLVMAIGGLLLLGLAYYFTKEN